MIFALDIKMNCLRLGVGLLFPTPAAAKVLWIDQAQRLQQVSAALLDTVPVPQPLKAGLSIGIRADLSFLPSPNPTVGAKIEKLPSAPVQSIPVVAASFGVELGESESVATEVWVGVLPAGVEKLLGIKASLSQTHVGARAQLASTRLGHARLSVGAGLARTQSKMSGQISSATGSDLFTAASLVSFAEIALQHERSGLWAGSALGKRKAESRLSIEEDETDLELTDTLADAKQPYWKQFSLGLKTDSHWSFALSELMVPDRLEMPRLTLAWEMPLR